MGKESQKTTSYTLSKEEIEKMLLTAHGNKLQPVNDEKVARQRQAIARYEARKEKAQADKDGDEEDDNDD